MAEEKNIVKKVRIALKRNTLKYFDAIKDTFVPLKGEVIIIDVAVDEIRAKVGDGINPLAKLPYTDETVRNMASGIVVQGYYFENNFYQDKEHKINIKGYDYKLYIDIITHGVYGFSLDENGFFEVNSVKVPTATNTVKGVSKLYSELGQNVDGSINQETITNEINKKFTIALDYDEGLIFEDGIPDNEV